MEIPAGYRFRPNAVELVGHYLQGVDSGRFTTEACFPLIQCADFYGEEEPWDTWSRFGGDNLIGQEPYFFSKPAAKLPKGLKNCDRKVGSGHWHMVSKPVGVRLPNNVFLGYKRSFSYRNTGSRADQNCCWNLTEFSLEEGNNEYVICQLKPSRKESGKRKAERGQILPSDERLRTGEVNGLEAPGADEIVTQPEIEVRPAPTASFPDNSDHSAMVVPEQGYLNNFHENSQALVVYDGPYRPINDFDNQGANDATYTDGGMCYEADRAEQLGKDMIYTTQPQMVVQPANLNYNSDQLSQPNAQGWQNYLQESVQGTMYNDLHRPVIDFVNQGEICEGQHNIAAYLPYNSVVVNPVMGSQEQVIHSLPADQELNQQNFQTQTAPASEDLMPQEDFDELWKDFLMAIPEPDAQGWQNNLQENLPTTAYEGDNGASYTDRGVVYEGDRVEKQQDNQLKEDLHGAGEQVVHSLPADQELKQQNFQAAPAYMDSIPDELIPVDDPGINFDELNEYLKGIV